MSSRGARGEPAPSRSGIVHGQNGENSHIPSSVRADGSVRKEIRIREGYRPPEDVDVYKNRTAEAFKKRGKGGVPGAEAVGPEPTTLASSAASVKNAKRREARKKAAAVAGDGGPAATEDTGATNGSPGAGEDATKDDATAAAAPEPIDPEAEKVKEARKLSKKLRQARELKDKKEKGDSLLPEQFEKVIKINELIRQLDKLGFDPDGEKKKESTSAPT